MDTYQIVKNRKIVNTNIYIYIKNNEPYISINHKNHHMTNFIKSIHDH